MKKFISLILLLIIFSSCNPDGENFIPDRLPLEGEYKLSFIVTVSRGTGIQEYDENYLHCFSNTILKVDRSDNFVISDFDINIFQTCQNLKNYEGSFDNILAFFGDPYGDVIIDSINEKLKFTSESVDKNRIIRIGITKRFEENLPVNIDYTELKYVFSKIK